MDLVRQLAVHFAFGDGHPMKNADRFFLHPITQTTPPHQGPDVTKIASMVMFSVFVFMVMMSMTVLMAVFMVLVFMMMVMMFTFVMNMAVIIIVVVICHVHIELHPFNPALLRPPAMQMVAVELERLKFALEVAEFDAEVEQCPDEHITADPAERIEIKRSHSSSPAANALIWLAA